MFNFIKSKIKKVYSGFTNKLSSIFSRNSLDEQFIKELSVLLLSADTGIKTTTKIIDQLNEKIKNKKIKTIDEVKGNLQEQLTTILNGPNKTSQTPTALLLVGINGSGKTTFISKIAQKLKLEKKKVLLVAGDTFRAAATQQLAKFANKIGTEIYIGKDNQDPAAVIFDACKKFKDEGFDHIIIDTAGRPQTKINLMKELEKIRKVVAKQLRESEIHTWLTIDAMLGQNSLQQAKIFNEATMLNGIVLTKLDGTGKGGIVFSIVENFNLPIIYITFGEQLDDIKSFVAEDYVQELLY